MFLVRWSGWSGWSGCLVLILLMFQNCSKFLRGSVCHFLSSLYVAFPFSHKIEIVSTIPYNIPQPTTPCLTASLVVACCMHAHALPFPFFIAAANKDILLELEDTTYHSITADDRRGRLINYTNHSLHSQNGRRSIIPSPPQRSSIQRGRCPCPPRNPS